jgi:hypothetical protein
MWGVGLRAFSNDTAHAPISDCARVVAQLGLPLSLAGAVRAMAAMFASEGEANNDQA